MASEQQHDDKTLWASTSIPKKSKKPTVPRHSRKRMHLRSHDDMLQEQYKDLAHLLNDRNNCSREEIQDQQIWQTQSLIDSYKSLNHGRAKGLFISRSLPSSTRNTSARSDLVSRTDTPSDTGGISRHQNNRGRRRGRDTAKKVSFQAEQPDKQHATQQRSTDETESLSGSEQMPSEEEACSSRSSLTGTTNSHDSGEDSEPDYDYNTDRLDHHVTHLVTRLNLGTVVNQQRKPSTYNYIRMLGKGPKRIGKPPNVQKQAKITTCMPSLYCEELHSKKPVGIVEDENGIKHSDCDLKMSNNSNIQQWLREKNKLLRAQKREQQRKKKKQRQEDKVKQEEKEKRKQESQTKLKEWATAKRKEAKLLRRKKQAVLNLAKRQNEIHSTARSNESTKPTEKSYPTPKRPKTAPTLKTTPPPQQSNTTPQLSDINVQILVDNNPDLKEKLRQLERQRNLKHRQSYEEWCKIKEKEKRDTLKLLREQRQKLEKEISDETARLISEAARKRVDGIKYRSTRPAEEQKAERSEEKLEAPSSSGSYPASHRWRSRSTTTTDEGQSSRTKLPKTPPVSSKQAASSDQRKRNIEDRIGVDTTNPFSDPFKPPKLRRPKSKMEQVGINGPDFSKYVWNLVNEQENSQRPEPQGADSPAANAKPPRPKSAAATTTASSQPTSPSSANPFKTEPTKQSRSEPDEPPMSRSPLPPKKPQGDGEERAEPIIETGNRIFSMTSVE